jgi:hypothetical protein
MSSSAKPHAVLALTALGRPAHGGVGAVAGIRPLQRQGALSRSADTLQVRA